MMELKTKCLVKAIRVSVGAVYDNLMFICRTCFSLKAARIVLQFLCLNSFGLSLSLCRYSILYAV